MHLPFLIRRSHTPSFKGTLINYPSCAPSTQGRQTDLLRTPRKLHCSTSHRLSLEKDLNEISSNVSLQNVLHGRTCRTRHTGTSHPQPRASFDRTKKLIGSCLRDYL